MTEQDNVHIVSAEILNDDYDSPWKDAVEHYFPDFMAFYFPEAYDCFDWSLGYTFLEQELRSVIHDAALGKRFVDKLAQLKHKNGDESWIYVHIEVQASKDKDFAKRMFTYNYRIFDRYNLPVGSFAVLADDHPNWQPDSFGYEVGGSRHYLEFPIAKLLRYADQIDLLLASDNPFALVTAAHLQTRATRGKNSERYQVKYKLMRTLLCKGWSSDKIRPLLKVLDWMLHLPEELDKQLWQDIQETEGEAAMAYVTSIERIGIEKGVQQGLQQGESRLLRKQLERRFGVLPQWASDKLNSAAEQDLESWGEAVLTASNLEAVFDNIPTH
jgi:hypothetical protein